MMAFEPLFLLALFTLILGNGAFKPNISTQVGGLYAPGDHRRDCAYSIFYVGINVGAFLAPLVCGTLGEELGWHYGFDARLIRSLGVLDFAMGSFPFPESRLRNGFAIAPPRSTSRVTIRCSAPGRCGNRAGPWRGR